MRDSLFKIRLKFGKKRKSMTKDLRSHVFTIWF